MTVEGSSGKEPARPGIVEVKEAVRTGRFDDARKGCEALLAAGESVDVLLLLGLACVRLGDAAAAVQPLTRALALAPDHVDALVTLGDAHAMRGALDSARDCFRRAMSLAPQHAPQLRGRYVQAGRNAHFAARGCGERGIHRDVPSLLADARGAAARGDIEHALGTLIAFGQQVLRQQLSSPLLANSDIAGGDRSIDACIAAIGALALPNLPAVPREPAARRTVHIATQLYTTGGHTRLLRSYADADKTREQIVLVTDLAQDTNREAVAPLFAGRHVEWCPPGTATTKLEWLMGRLYALAPERVILFQHHFDAVALAACQPELVPDLYFVHHADYTFTFGVYFPRATHIDGSLQDLENCRRRLGVTGNLFVPYTADDRGLNPAPSRPGARALTTCTASTHTKLSRPAYRYSYLDLFPRLFKQRVKRHVHIGELPGPMLAEIYRRLDSAKIPRERFDYRGNVPSFWDALREHDIDVCIGSFPIGGGLTVTEAMGSGTPYVVHGNYVQRVLCEIDQIYPEGFVWRELDELDTALDTLAGGACPAHAKAARAQYERFHLPSQLTAALSGARVVGAHEPALRPHRRDNLQIVLDTLYVPTG
jgi:hypothetical protein